MEELVAELFTYNKSDDCYDPIGSIDRFGMAKIIEVISREKQAASSKAEARAQARSLLLSIRAQQRLED